MAKLTDEFCSYALHVALATFPPAQERNFDRGIKEDFFSNYRDQARAFFSEDDKTHWYFDDQDQVPILYNPISYLLLDNFDVAYITLIDNFKFAQRLFEPRSKKEKEGRNIFGPHTFQTFTGIAKENDDYIKSFFYNHLKSNATIKKYFVGICNLKFNNGILIGNGYHLVEAADKKIEQVISEINNRSTNGPVLEFLRMQSLAWFEWSLLLFTDDPQIITDVLQQIRRLTLADIESYNRNLAKDCLYQTLYPEKPVEAILDTNIFADTQVYIGLHSDLVDNDAFFEEFKSKNIKLKTEVEWHVKPGHMHLLTELLRYEPEVATLFDHETDFLIGSKDYSLNARFNDASKNVQLMRLIMNKSHNLFEHIRRVKTKIYFKGTGEVNFHSPRKLNLIDRLTDMAESITAISRIDSQLKALKISRQIRTKIVKLFSNYNYGIQDPILFPYLLDFTIFIDRLKILIKEASDLLRERFESPEKYSGSNLNSHFEELLMSMINIFQDGFNIRMLNNYQLEDINDFDLDFNSSAQQLLSTYSTLAFELGNLIYSPDYSYGPVIQLNMKDTASNNSSISYHINHLTSPEFIFATFSKEILNTVIYEDDPLVNLISEYENLKKQLFDYDQLLQDMNKRGLINIAYYFNDAIRFSWTYRGDFDLYYYWFWAYNFQNSSLYDEMGTLDSEHFQKELFRILVIRNLFTINFQTAKPLDCPVAELETFWQRYYQQISNAAERFIAFLDERKISVKFINYLQGRLYLMAKRSDRDLVVDGRNVKDAYEIIRFLTGRYFHQLDIISYDFANVLARRCFSFEQLSNGNVDKIVPEDSILYLEWYIWQYLKTIYDENGRTVQILRRNWRDGKPMMPFTSSESTYLYVVDQTGGLFFDNVSKQTRYLQMSAQVITDIWHYASVRKKHFIASKFKIRVNDWREQL